MLKLESGLFCVLQYYNYVEKKVDCIGLFTNPNIDAPTEYTVPPRKIPTYL